MNGERSGAYRGVRLCRQPGGEAIKGGVVKERREVRSVAAELLRPVTRRRCLERTAGTEAVCWPGPPIAIAVGRRTCGAGLVQPGVGADARNPRGWLFSPAVFPVVPLFFSCSRAAQLNVELALLAQGEGKGSQRSQDPRK
jgi:hypothetical protein